MANRYWVSNSSTSANVAANWNTNANGTGSTGIPTTSDDVFFGHADTLAAGLGNIKCTWDITPTLTSIAIYEDYSYSIKETSAKISFAAPSIITHSDSNWADLGFRAGMTIAISGATNAANNGTFNILSIADNTINVTQTSIVVEAIGATVSILYSSFVDIAANFGTNLLTLEGTISNTSGSNKTISFAGTHLSGSLNRYILNGAGAQILNQDILIYDIDGSANGASVGTYFDNGPHPVVKCVTATSFCFGYKVPHSNLLTETDIYSLQMTSSTAIALIDSTSTPFNNNSKVFNLLTTSNFAWGSTTFNAGISTWTFKMDATNFAFPVSDGTTTYKWHDVKIITPTTAGFKATIPKNRTLSVNSITVEADAVLEGHKTENELHTSVISSIRKPKILGSWNFSQLADGIYVSLIGDTFPITPADGVTGRVQLSSGAGAFTSDEKLTWTSATSTLLVDGKLTVTGLIDPTGMEFTAVAANPSSTNPTKTIWVNSGDSNKLYFGSSEVGAGSGTVTSIATTAPLTGGTITSTGTLGIDISALTANTAIADADLLLLDDGADGTNRKITFTEVKEWIRGGGVIIGRDGGVNQLRIRDSRDDGDVHPNDFPSKAVSFDFTDDITGSPNVWDSIMTMKGWSDNYRAWQIFSSAASGTQSVDEVPLFFRSGEEDVQDGWGQTKEILTFAGTAPRVDGANGQVLQTNGSGVLSWATISAGANGVAGAVQFSDGSSLSSDDANLHYDDANNVLGIGLNNPDTDVVLHTKSTGNYHLRHQMAEGNLRFNKYGHMQIQNENASDAGSIDDPIWQLGQRDAGQLDIAFGNIATQLVAASDALISMSRVSNSATGAKKIGFLGATAVERQTAPAAVPFGPAANADLNAQAINSLITALTNLGLIG